jgi:hypothetical protein
VPAVGEGSRRAATLEHNLLLPSKDKFCSVKLSSIKEQQHRMADSHRLACALETVSGPVLVGKNGGGYVPVAVQSKEINALTCKNVGGHVSAEVKCIPVNNVSLNLAPQRLKRAGVGKVVIDSGAGESVIPWQMLPQEPLVESKRANSTYRDASGHVMQNKGQKEVKMIVNGKIASMVFQATDVRKPLASVNRIVQKGNTVVFDSEHSYILNKATGVKTPIESENGAYVMNVEYLVPADTDGNDGALRGSSFTRPAQ